MTAHELAKRLLSAPDWPVVVHGWGHDNEIGVFVVTEMNLETREGLDDKYHTVANHVITLDYGPTHPHE